MSPGASTSPRTEAPGPGGAPRVRGWPGTRGEVVREAVAGLRRNALMAAAATTTIAIALTVAGGGLLVTANLVHLAGILEGQVEIVGFLRRDLPVARQRRALAEVQAVPGVRTAELVGRAEALRRLQRTFGSLASIGAHLPANPLPDSIEVRVAGAGRVRAVADALRRVEGIEEVLFGTPVVDRLVALTRAVRIVGAAVAGLLMGASLLTILNTIRLTIAARRQEIEIMTLVGATHGVIRGPFILEGVLQGAVAAAAATAVLVLSYSSMARQAAASLPFLPVLPSQTALPGAVVAVWLLGVAVGVAGSEIGVRRYLRA